MPRLFLLIILSIFIFSCKLQTTKSASGERVLYSTGPDDGRFTLGGGNKRIMYGYPIPTSTSHFIIKVDDLLASNYRGFGSKATYLSTKRGFKTVGNQKYCEMIFNFNGIQIVQRLIPVDKNFVEVDSTRQGQYYRIEYEFENILPKTKNVGLLLLIDNMIDDNDAPEMDVDGKRTLVESKFEGAAVPSQVYLYRTAGDLSDMTAEVITDKGKAVKPDELYLGRWPYFHSVTWDVTATGIKYTDAALLLRWKVQPLEFNQKRRVATHYGLATRKKANTSNHNNTTTTSSTTTNSGSEEGLTMLLQESASPTLITDTIFFDNADAHLSQEFKARLDRLLQNRDLSKIQGIIIEGHTDAVGDEEGNVNYSKKRAGIVKEYFVHKTIPAFKIITKGYGESYANQSEKCVKEGNPKDRNAVLIIYMSH
jgi:outer membrane protein OmpA-like peptidoglycan-associated protein